MIRHVAAALAVLILISVTARAADDGKLDTVFASDGFVTTDLGGLDFGIDMALHVGGKIVVVGYSRTEVNGEVDYDGILARYDVTGELDTTFGNGGIVRDAVSGPGGPNRGLTAVAIQADGKIVVAGWQGSFQLIERHNYDGSPDLSFGTNGVVMQRCAFLCGVLLNDVAVSGNGRIATLTDEYLIELHQNLPGGELAEDFGDLNPSLGSGDGNVFMRPREVTSDLDLNELGAESIAIQPDGKILVITSALEGTSLTRIYSGMVVARFNADGTVDTSFGSAGNGTFHLDQAGFRAFSVAVMPNGKIVAVGTGLGGFVVVRFLPNGALDPGFGNSGISYAGSNVAPFDALVAIEDNGGGLDGRIILGGNTNTGSKLILMRLKSDGSVDSSFNSSEKDFGTSATMHGLALRDDRLWIVGRKGVGGDSGNTDLLVARFVNYGEIGIGVIRQYLTSVTCSDDVSAISDLGKCGAVVEYPDPVLGDAGFVQCAPASGSLFGVGVTATDCVSVVGDGTQNSQRTASCSFDVTVDDVEPPSISCPAVVVPTDAGQCSASPAIPVSAGDNCAAGTPAITPPGGSVFGLGTTSYSASVSDLSGNVKTCSSTVTVVDETPPQIQCNTAGVEVRPGKSVSIEAGATDSCSISSVAVTGYDCWRANDEGIRVDASSDCSVSIAGAQVNILRPGGVGTRIEWTVEATDGSGNVTTALCQVESTNPSAL